MRDEDFLEKLGANPLQLYRKKAIENVFNVIKLMFGEFKKPLDVDRIEAELDYYDYSEFPIKFEMTHFRGIATYFTLKNLPLLQHPCH